jgi:hypothetical protein
MPAGAVTPPPSQFAITLPSVDGFSGMMLLALAGAGSVNASVSTGTLPPAGVPAPTGSDQPLLFVGLQTEVNVALTGMPAFNLIAPDTALQSVRRVPQSGDFNVVLDFFDPGAPLRGFQAGLPCAVDGDAIACAAGSVPFDAIAHLEYVFEIARRPVPVASPPGSGAVVIAIPTPSPVVCAPASVAIAVKQTVAITCTAQDTAGPFTFAVANPTIATVQQFNAQDLNVFNVTGVTTGTTTLSFQSVPGGSGSVTIAVSP